MLIFVTKVFFVINTGILSYNKPTHKNTFTIYPNPANEHITIEYGTISSLLGAM